MLSLIAKLTPNKGSEIQGLVNALYEMTNPINRNQAVSVGQQELFDGSEIKYRRFIRYFDSYTIKGVTDAGTKLNLLIASCCGKARESIADCIMCDYSELGYVEARKILEDTYGQEHNIIDAYISKLTDGPPIKMNDTEAIRQLAADMRSCAIACDGRPESSLNAHVTIGNIFKRLPNNLQDKFLSSISMQLERGRPATFSQLSEFLQRTTRLQNTYLGQMVCNRRSNGGAPSQRNSHPIKASFYATQGSVKEQPGSSSADHRRIGKCSCCSANHQLWKCQRYNALSVKERLDLVKENRLCFNCLGSHLAKDCRSQKSCLRCGMNHHTLLHREQNQATAHSSAERSNGAGESDRSTPDPTIGRFEESLAMQASSRSNFVKGIASAGVKLKVIPVKVFGPGNRSHISTYAFLDEGSDTTLCTMDLMNALHLKRQPVEYSISTIAGVAKQRGYKVSLNIRGFGNLPSLEIQDVIAIPSLPDLQDSIPSNQDVKRYKHLEGLSFPALKSKRINMLIGANVQAAHIQRDFRQGSVGEPNAVLTDLGWGLVGPVGKHNHSNVTGFCHVHSVQADSDVLHKQFVEMYQHDFSEVTNEDTPVSIEDRRALSIMDQSINHRNGHYEIALPWKNNQVKLPPNRALAERRLECLKKRLLNDDNLCQRYKLKIDDYLANGYARKVPSHLLGQSDRTWYLPHHATSAKFRVVFDCAAKYKGSSLNDNLLQGPDLTSNLVGVLIRFRKHPVAVIADIRSMFHQVRVKAQDCDSLRFLWWPNGDLSARPQDYQMMVHLFGATSSPSCCSFALRRVSKEFVLEEDVEVVDCIVNSFYVDDFLRSFRSAKEAKFIVTKLAKVLDEGGFHLTKFHSNIEASLELIPEEDRSAPSVNLDLDRKIREKTLGVLWNSVSDQFEIQINVKQKPLTRRGILSMVSQVYDPLGIIHPFLLQAKQLMQDLCAQRLGWDEVISDAKRELWLRWLNSLHHLERIKVARCMSPLGFHPISFQLHCFSDASSVGYGAVAYLRMINAKGNIHCCFLQGKARVAPLKQVTIPRMELAAAVVSTKLVKFLKRELHLRLDGITFWTDSTSVLQYIRNNAKRFQVFVANRVAQIHANSDPSQWRHVDTKSNPADIASRGLMPDQLNKADIWFQGPPFLRLSESSWPEQPKVSTQLSSSDPEVRIKINVITSQNCEDEIIDRLLCSSSCFTRLKKKVAWILRYRQYLRSKLGGLSNNIGMQTGRLIVKELETAALEIIKLVQRKSFPDELFTLTNSSQHDFPKVVVKSSSLKKLCPVLDQGVLRVGGRLQRSPFSIDIKHPIILPRSHHVTELIINFFHEKEGHCGPQHTLAAVRTRYWIVKGHATVRKALRKCRICRIKYGVGGEQIMAPLPGPRVTPGKPAFTCVGVDYAGPFFTKVGRNRLKRYLCVFTCLSSRAVHIELSFSLDTHSFLQALQRFISRRGTPQTVYSDNGSNFVGAAKELRDGFKRLNKNLVHNRLIRQGIDWVFLPPAASHQGGVWERMIRSIRKIMLGLTSQRLLTDEELLTFTTEVERIINNRPLTPVSSDPNDLEALTPNSLLIQRLDNSLPLDSFIKADGYKKSWRYVNWLADQFWSRWTKEYLPTLQIRQKWLKPVRNFCVGDVVLIIDDIRERGKWPKGRVKEVFAGKDGHVRSLRIRTATSSLVRDVRKLCLLEAAE